MEKRTLQFATLAELTAFARTLAGGYLINTKNNTLTGKMHDYEVDAATAAHGAREVETTERVFSYDAL